MAMAAELDTTNPGPRRGGRPQVDLDTPERLLPSEQSNAQREAEAAAMEQVVAAIAGALPSVLTPHWHGVLGQLRDALIEAADNRARSGTPRAE